MKADLLLNDFFGPGNEVALDGLMSGRYGEHGRQLEPWLERLRRGQWTILPRRANETLAWYALASSVPERDRISPVLRAWIGPGFTDFDGSPPGDCADDWERRLHSDLGPQWLRCRVLPHRTDDVRNALFQLAEMEGARPAVPLQDAVPTGRLIRDFDWALRAGDENSSRSILESLEASGRLSAMNLQYLRVQRLHALEQWNAMLLMPGLGDVVASRRPRAVTRALLRSIYEHHLADLIGAGEITVASAVFDEVVAGRFNALFDALPVSPEPHEMWLYAFWASSPPAKPSLIDEIATSVERLGLGDSNLRIYLDSQSPPERSPDPMTAVKRAIDDYAFSSALEQLREIDDGAEHAALTVRCAVELETPDAMAFAKHTLFELGDEDLAVLRASRVMRGLIERIHVFTNRPRTWAELVAGIRDGAVQAQDLDWVRAEVSQWSHSQLVDQHEAVVSGIVSDVGSQEGQVLRSVLPWLLDAIDRYPATDDVRLREIASAVAHSLALTETRSTQEREALVDLSEGLIDGASQREYVDLLELISYVMETDDSPYLVPWVLEALEVVAGYPVLDASARDQFAARAVGFLQRRSDRLTTENRLVATLVFEEFGFELGDSVAVPQSASDQLVQWPSALEIGIYTLTPGVGERVVKSVRELHPMVNVRVNSDHVATEGLRMLAQMADVFVIVSRSAKHAATDAIKTTRSKELPTLYSNGKGSSSILKVLNDYMATL